MFKIPSHFWLHARTQHRNPAITFINCRNLADWKTEKKTYFEPFWKKKEKRLSRAVITSSSRGRDIKQNPLVYLWKENKTEDYHSCIAYFTHQQPFVLKDHHISFQNLRNCTEVLSAQILHPKCHFCK
jgi:hypothetical protein